MMKTQDPLFIRMNWWRQERFPFINVFTAMLIYFTAKIPLQNWTTGHVSLDWQDFFGVGFVVSHFLLLRVLDEHKDYTEDLVYHPDRIVQRGLVTLRELRTLGVFNFIFQMICVAVLFLYRSTPIASDQVLWTPLNISLGLLGLIFVWTLLMKYEFFCREYLRKRIMLYSLLHLVVSPMIFLFVVSLQVSGLETVWQYSMVEYLATFGVQMSALFVLALASGLIFEMTRKNRTPQEDALGEISFSSVFGRPLTAGLILVSSGVLLIGLFLFLKSIDLFSPWVFVGLIFLGMEARSLIHFTKSPTEMNQKKLVGTGALLSLFAFVTPILLSLTKG